MEPVRTEVDSAAALWNIIPRRPFTILDIRGGANLFGQTGNYVGTIFLAEGNYTGIMIDHWTGKVYAATGSSYNENDIHFTPVS